MEIHLPLQILPQPNDTTCGPTCLQSIYTYYNDYLDLSRVIAEVQMLEDGGTMAVLLGCHALSRGYETTLYTFDMQVFDPTWFTLPAGEMAEKLKRQYEVKQDRKMGVVTNAYLQYLEMGGNILLADLTMDLLRGFLKKEIPIITGLSCTYLYRSAREVDRNARLFFDDINGEPTPHFVVLSGYDTKTRSAMIADPFLPNPMGGKHHYEVKLNRLIPAIMLATLSFDANLLVITPKK